MDSSITKWVNPNSCPNFIYSSNVENSSIGRRVTDGGISDFNTGKFGKDFGLEITDGPLAGLHSRVVIVLDENGVVKHAEQVGEIADEPNYEAALKAL